DIIKVHVHTDNPGNALQEGLKFGALTKIKIENMREQHDGQKAAVKLQSASDEFEYKEVNPNVEYGFVSVAAGDGIISLFKDIGADNVVSGGQTMNPSTDDILSAIHATPAKVVFVLPNNKNIIMAAEQAAKLADRKVYVLPTRTVPQGISAMLAFDPEKQTNDNLVAMTKAFERVMTGQITFAARDSDFEGHKIKKGELLALENGKLAFTEKDLSRAVSRVAKNLVKKDSEYSFVTLIYGENVKEEEANQILQAVKEKMPDNVEINLINGGQPVYYFIISAE
ncbi:MAG TPA: dihydroxyacetone kinase, partial [Ruminococcaceae bacterium]|nr:dihydroxyacetone kinase [Oscillospiraceae bacterium]